jgi:glyoxylase-like metal-dependent hydrolase (beta-lactamase superfamily II)
MRMTQLVFPDQRPDGVLAGQQQIKIAGTELRVLHTPGHSPGSGAEAASLGE